LVGLVVNVNRMAVAAGSV